MQANILHNHL
uniref:Uncharacterized protein n=1 Tax=Arundo donax TaxID=35708 RepID=A0A0A8YVH0_ARUDO